MILGENNLQTVQEWTKSYIELIALYVHPKNSNHLRSHSRAIMALDHSRLGLENKFLENKSGRIFLRSTGLLYKFLPTNLRVCKPTFYTFYTSHLRWNSTMRRCFYHTDLGQNAVFYKWCHSKSDFRLWQATYFSTKSPINRLAMNNRRLFCTSSGKRQLRTSQVDTKLCQLQLLKWTSLKMLHKFPAWTHLSNFDQ